MPKDEANRPVIRRLWLRSVAAAGATLALLISWGMDIQARRDAPAIPDVSAGTDVDTGAYRISLRQAKLSHSLPDGSRVPGAQPVVLVTARAENLTSSSRNDLRAVLPPASASAPLYLASDRTRLGYLEPRLPADVVIVLPAPQGSLLRLTLMGRSYKARDNLSGAAGWFGAKPVATVVLPVGAEGGLP